MVPVRALIVVLAFSALGGSAHAQAPSPDLEVLRAQQAAAASRAIDQENQLQALDARLRADRAASPTERAVVRLPELPFTPPATTPAAQAARTYPSIPDAALADSNRRVREALKHRR